MPALVDSSPNCWNEMAAVSSVPQIRPARRNVFFCSALYFSRGCRRRITHTSKKRTSAAGTARIVPKEKQPICPALRLSVTKELPQIIAVMSGRTICRTFLLFIVVLLLSL